MTGETTIEFVEPGWGRDEELDTGVGTRLVRTLEAVALSQDASEIVLNARDSAWAFYERLGYEYAGRRFTSTLTGIVHRPMRTLLFR